MCLPANVRASARKQTSKHAKCLILWRYFTTPRLVQTEEDYFEEVSLTTMKFHICSTISDDPDEQIYFIRHLSVWTLSKCVQCVMFHCNVPSSKIYSNMKIFK